MAPTQWAKAHYLDASAMVKLVAESQDAGPLREYFHANANFCCTLFCLLESLGVLKGKWNRGALSIDEYFNATRRLVVDAWGKRIELDDVGMVDPGVFSRVEEFGRRYSLDLSDALQILTIKDGRYSALGPNSASVLITADSQLAAAAASEGIRAWNCISGTKPSWV